MMTLLRMLFVALALLVPGMALAHVSAAAPSGHLLAGLLHPWTGVDHLLGLMTLGALIRFAGGAAGRSLLAMAMAGLATGMLAGIGGLLLPANETLLALSLLASGLILLLVADRPRRGLGLLLMACSALHGYVHAVESSGSGFLAGFVISSVTLIGLGLVVAEISMTPRRMPARVLGAGTVLVALGGLLHL
ncbi:HupE/UreJ family protein [Thiohalobacter sp.]|uniref:HupE/UreJ family protein n=1 Tax=Thiohalobacter sp. TaxID=2025948 RepID=UPI0026078970|nr:HupE/UreJ family protein [Thiohalobacter sp.]